MSEKSSQQIALSYSQLYQKFGYSPKALGWDKGKQFLRFFQLTRDWQIDGTKILDVGCGFGDFIKFLNLQNVKNYAYTGVDFVKEFIVKAQELFPASNNEFIEADFLQTQFGRKFDYAIASGTFNLVIEDVDGYDYIFKNMEKMFSLADKAISLDFVSDKVDLRYEKNFYSSPEKILTMAYHLSKNVILRNDFFPFEFAVTIYKNDSFRKETTLFSEIEKPFEWLIKPNGESF